MRKFPFLHLPQSLPSIDYAAPMVWDVMQNHTTVFPLYRQRSLIRLWWHILPLLTSPPTTMHLGTHTSSTPATSNKDLSPDFFNIFQASTVSGINNVFFSLLLLFTSSLLVPKENVNIWRHPGVSSSPSPSYPPQAKSWSGRYIPLPSCKQQWAFRALSSLLSRSFSGQRRRRFNCIMIGPNTKLDQNPIHFLPFLPVLIVPTLLPCCPLPAISISSL